MQRHLKLLKYRISSMRSKLLKTKINHLKNNHKKAMSQQMLSKKVVIIIIVKTIHPIIRTCRLARSKTPKSQRLWRKIIRIVHSLRRCSQNKTWKNCRATPITFHPSCLFPRPRHLTSNTLV